MPDYTESYVRQAGLTRIATVNETTAVVLLQYVKDVNDA